MFTWVNIWAKHEKEDDDASQALHSLAPNHATEGMPGATIQEHWQVSHKANPHAYRLILQMVLLKWAGHARYSIKRLFEVLRFDCAIRTVSDDGFKRNPQFRSPYARRFMTEEPKLDDLSETRVCFSR